MRGEELQRKLGIKTGMSVLLRGAPAELASLLTADGVRVSETSEERADCVLAFVRSKAEVEAMAPAALAAVAETGLVWFAYPKKSGAVKSDLSRDSGWEPVLAAGFDSVAQISIDETWTGFRFRPKHLIGRR